MLISTARQQLDRAVPPSRAPRIVSLAEYHAHVLEQLRAHDISAEWRRPDQLPVGIGGYAKISQKQIVVPPMDSEENIATVLHEIGHICAEPCRGAPHFKDPAVRDWSCCLKCEVDAWAIGIVLLRPLPWSRRMHARLVHALKSYRRQTPGYEAAKRALDAFAQEIVWHKMRQRAVETSLQGARARLAFAMR